MAPPAQSRFQGNGLACALGLILCALLWAGVETACFFLKQGPYADLFLKQPYKSYLPNPQNHGERKFAIPTSYHLLSRGNHKVNYPQRQNEELDYSKKFERGFYTRPWRLAPNRRSRSVVVLRRTGETVYDVQYTTDSFGRRLIPNGPDQSYKKHLLFLGCSLTFGEGVQDNQTFPAIISKLTRDHHVYNMGMPGSSPAEILKRIQEGYAWAGVKENRGAAIYTFMDDHVNRVFGPMSVRATWGSHLPFIYENSAGHFTVKGSFLSEEPFLTMIYQWLWQLPSTQFFHINLPFRLEQTKFTTFARMVRQIKDAYLEQFPGQKFYVAFFPNGNSQLASALIPEFERMGIHYLDYSQFDIAQYTAKDITIPWDRHPSAETHRIWGEILARDLIKFK